MLLHLSALPTDSPAQSELFQVLLSLPASSFFQAIVSSEGVDFRTESQGWIR